MSIVPSEQYFVRAYGDQPVLDRLNVEVHGDELKVANNSLAQICFFCSLRSARLEIGMPEPEELQLSGAVRTTLNGFNLDGLRVLLSGAASVESDSYSIARFFLYVAPGKIMKMTAITLAVHYGITPDFPDGLK